MSKPPTLIAIFCVERSGFQAGGRATKGINARLRDLRLPNGDIRQVWEPLEVGQSRVGHARFAEVKRMQRGYLAEMNHALIRHGGVSHTHPLQTFNALQIRKPCISHFRGVQKDSIEGTNVSKSRKIIILDRPADENHADDFPSGRVAFLTINTLEFLHACDGIPLWGWPKEYGRANPYGEKKTNNNCNLTFHGTSPCWECSVSARSGAAVTA